MTISVYPASPLPSYSYQVSQAFQTLISNYDSGAETRRQLIRFSKRGFINQYNYKSLADRNTIHQFFRQMWGAATAFWYFEFNSAQWVDEYLGTSVIFPMTGALSATHPDSSDANRVDETANANNATVNDMTLMQSSPAQNDAYYFGYVTAPWDLLRLQIGTPGVGTWAFTWEYWNGSSWTALSNVTDGTTNFTAAAGLHDVIWDQPANMALSTIKSISAYWVRARLSSFTSKTTSAIGTQSWCGSRYFDLHGKSTSSVNVYDNGVLQTLTTNYTLLTGGGGGNSDRVKFVAMPQIGDLLTSDFSGYLRIKGRFKVDSLQEDIVAKSVPLYTFQTQIQEVQW